MRISLRRARFTATLAAAALALTACGTGDDQAASDDAMDVGQETTEDMDGDMDADMDTDSDADMNGDDAMALPTGEFGPACDQIPAEGAGSSEGMAGDPAATAASNNPLLTTLVSLVGATGLVDTINNAEALTIFAPTDQAFEDLQAADPELFETVANDPDLLTTVLTYHVIGEELDAQALADQGSADTLAEQELSFSVDGETVTVEAAGNEATVICGNVETANATVHIIDTVLLPDVG